MGKNKKNAVLTKLVKNTFKDAKDKHIFEAETIFGTVLDDSIGILLSANEDVSKMVLQVGKININLNVESLDFLIKSLVTLGAMLASEGDNAFREKLNRDQSSAHEGEEGISFSRIKSKKKNEDDLIEGADLIAKHTDRLINENVIKGGIKDSDIENKRRVAERAIGLVTKLCKKVENDLLLLISRGISIADSDMNFIDKSISLCEAELERVKTSNTSLELSRMPFELSRLMGKVASIHKESFVHFTEEEQKEIVENMYSMVKNVDALEEPLTSDNLDLDDKEAVDDFLDSMLKRDKVNTESSVASIEEGVMEEVVSKRDVVKDIPKQSIDKESQEIEEYLEQAENTPNDDFDTMLSGNSGLFNIEDELFAGDAEEQECLDIEAIEADTHGYANWEDDNATPIHEAEDDDEDDDEDEESDFLQRMSDLEGLLTGNFEKLEEEVPTFEKIEQLRVEHGELAAKEYVSSLSQEQREYLVKERMEMKLAASQSKLES